MGRKTFESIGHPLEGRRNIVLTTRPDYIASGCAVVHSVPEALAAAVGNEEVLIIGGGLVYEQFLPIADRLYLTLIESAFDGDSYFPTLDEDKWREVARETHEADGDHPWPFNFVVLERIRDEP